MTADMMRKLDYYAGVPLCFLGTIIKKCFSLFDSGTPDKQPRNVLFIELSEMGSTILATPAINKVKHALDANIFFAIFQKNSVSLDLCNITHRDNIFVMPDSGLLRIVIGAARFYIWTRRKHIDTVIDLELFARFTAILAGFSGAVRTVGFYAFHNEGLYRGDFLTHKVIYNPHKHISKNFIALVNALLSETAEVPYSKTFIADEEATVRKVDVRDHSKSEMRLRIKDVCSQFDPEQHSVVLFNVNTSDLIPQRRWPQQYYIATARLILERFQNVVILLIGDISARAVNDVIVKAIDNARCANFAGRTSVPDLPALCSVSTFMLTSDSGPAHFASLTDMPVFVMFGPETPALYCPLGSATPIYTALACSPCVSAMNQRKSPCNDNICMRMLTPEKVYQTLLPSLELLR